MSVSVVVVNWNGGALLSRCLQHLSAQTRPADRIFLVDNASTDGSLDNLPDLPQLTVCRMERNTGFAAANNAALALCDTEFVAFLNPDAFADPQWLASLMRASVEHPGTAGFGSRQMMTIGQNLIDDIGDCYHVGGIAWQRSHGQPLSPAALQPAEIFAPCAAAAMYRLSVLREVGGFDESYFCYMEDLDLGFRVRLRGHAIRYVPDAVVHHVGSVSSGGRLSDFAVYHGHRNAVWTFVKNMPGALFWLALPLHLLVNLAMVLRFVRLGQGSVILRAKRDALRGLARVWSQRRAVQKARVASIGEIWRFLQLGFSGYKS